MHRAAIPALIVAVAVAGCSSSGNGVSTSSILGSAPTPPAAEAAAALPAASTPTSRAFQAGSVAARAKKCGYNFDETRLRSSFLAHEVSVGTTPDQIAQVEKVYDVAHNGIAKAAAGEADYCSDQKTRIIKADLNRLLAGDFEPPLKPVAKKEEDDDGFFGGLFGGSPQEDNFGSGDWWAKQQEKAGG